MSEHAFGEGAISRCKHCKALRSRKGKGFIYSAPEGRDWFAEPSECPGILQLEALVLERGGYPVSVDAPAGGGLMLTESGWRSREIVFFDLETTGLDPRTNVPTEVGFVRGKLVEDGPNGLGVEVLDRYKSLCFVPESLADKARETEAITGISYDELKGAPHFAFVAHQVREFLSAGAPDALLASFNAHFDVPFLGYAHVRCGEELHPILQRQEVLDPMLWSRKLDKYAKGGHKLVTVAERKKVVDPAELAGAHRADFDAEIGLRVLAYFARDARVPESLEELWLWQQMVQGEWAANFFDYKIKKLREGR